MKLLQLNTREWTVYALAERSILLSLASSSNNDVEIVQHTSKILESEPVLELKDIVASYNSIALFLENPVSSLDDFAQVLQSISFSEGKSDNDYKAFDIPVCYDLGIDWKDVSSITGLTKQEAIKLHTASNYSVALVGFMPGFAYLSGMDEKLTCPRREFPRIKVPKGAVGIGGAYSGIYSFPCPGGWQIIGQTPVSLFDIHSMPPSSFNVGDRFKFYEISLDEFNEIEGK